MFSHSAIASLNNLEMMVYNNVIKNRDKVMYMTIRELADAAGVSTTTILRFCRKLNCDGYSEFRVRFKLYLEQNEPTLCDQLMLEDTLMTSCNQIGRTAQQMVDKTLRELMQTTLMPDRRTNPLGWTQLTNSLKKQAEEAVLPMLYEI